MVQSLAEIILVLTLVGRVAGGLYGCSNSINTDYYRQVALELHKQYRQFVFDGEAPNKCGSVPQPKNYFSIEYNCDLEDSAAEWANECTHGYSNGTINKGAGEFIQMMTAGSTPLPQILINSFFYKVVNMFPPVGVTEDASLPSNAGDWSRVAGAGTYQVGCATKLCSGSAMTVCHYKVKGPLTGQIYNVGEGCASDADCDVILQSTCNAGWCHAPEEVNQDENNMCGGTNPNMNDGARTTLLNAHNHYRALVIQGNEPAGTNSTRISPRGGNMYKLKYSCEIEANAQAYADTCPFPTHSDNEDRPGWGENMAWLSSTGDVAAAFTTAIKMFYDELKDYGLVLLDNNTFTSADSPAGHYTQVCWAKTYEVGCGIKVCPNGYHIVCQYNPAGNYLNNIVYPLGNPCTTDADCTVQAADTCSTSDGLCNRA